MKRKFIPISAPTIGKKEVKYVTDAVKSGWVSSIGNYIERFEKMFAEYCGTKHAIVVSNGTTAIHLALTALEIEKGDEVIVPDFSFVATANAAAITGAKIVFADIESDTLCISASSIKELITSRTKAIIPVHVYGHPAAMNEINEIARKHNLLVIEDCAEAHGAMIGEKKVGSFGNCGTFSFYGNKIITTGEGGMITTNDSKLAARIRELKDHAMSTEKKYWHTKVGFNYRITNLQAAVGVAQMERMDEIQKKKDEIFYVYKEELSAVLNKNIRLNKITNRIRNVFWMICFENDFFTEKTRDGFMTELKKMGVDSRPYFYPISDMPMYKKADTPVTHSIYSKGILLPTFFDIKKEEIKFVCSCVKKLLTDVTQETKGRG